MATPFDLGLVNGNSWGASSVDAIESSINSIKSRNGFALDAWVPTFSQGVAVNRTIIYAKHQRLGRLVWCQFQVGFTSAGTSGQPLTMSGLPANIVVAANYTVLGSSELYIVSATAKLSYHIMATAATAVDFRSMTNVSADNRYGMGGGGSGLAINDTLTGSFMYEAATD